MIIYGTPEAQAQIAQITDLYPILWEPGGITNIPEKNWMTIPLKPDTKVETTKIYPLKIRDREFVDEIFNKLYKERKIEYSNKPTPHDYPIFVI